MSNPKAFLVSTIFVNDRGSTVSILPRVHRLSPPLDLLSPVRLVTGDDAPPEGWTVGTREPCGTGHGSDEECEGCRGVCLDDDEPNGAA